MLISRLTVICTRYSKEAATRACFQGDIVQSSAGTVHSIHASSFNLISLLFTQQLGKSGRS